MQSAILRHAAAAVKPGGTLVYSTCTVLPEENEERIRHFLDQNPSYRQVPKDELPPSVQDVVDEAGTMRCTPHQHGTDGFFATRMERIE